MLNLICQTHIIELKLNIRPCDLSHIHTDMCAYTQPLSLTSSNPPRLLICPSLLPYLFGCGEAESTRASNKQTARSCRTSLGRRGQELWVWSHISEDAWVWYNKSVRVKANSTIAPWANRLLAGNGSGILTMAFLLNPSMCKNNNKKPHKYMFQSNQT